MAAISVIMPVYNATKYLERAVKSVFAQTFADYELILVDDGSTDGSSELCDKIAEADARVRVIHQKNGGTSSARNAGVAAARGEYIAFIDNDDYALPAWLADMHAAAVSEGADLVKCGFLMLAEGACDCESIKTQEDLPLQKGILTAFERETLSGDEFLVRLATSWGYNAVWNQLCKAEFLKQCLFPVGQLSEDVSVCIDLSLLVKKTVCLPEVLYCWLQRPSSQTHTSCLMGIGHAITHTRMIELLLERGDAESARLCAAKKARQIFIEPMGCEATASGEYDELNAELYGDMRRDEERLHFLPLLNRIERAQYFVYGASPALYNAIMRAKARLDRLKAEKRGGRRT